MAVSEVIASMQENLANAYTSAESKNATMPEQKNLANLSATIDSITSGGGSEEWQPDADMQWARQSLIDDVQEGYTYKTIQLIPAVGETSDLVVKAGCTVKTNDGGYYTNTETSDVTITHTWDDTKAKQSGKYNFKLRWIINTFASERTDSISYWDITVIYVCTNMRIVANISRSNLEYLDTIDDGWYNPKFQYCHSLQGVSRFVLKEYNLSNTTSFQDKFFDCSTLKEIPELDTSNITTFNSAFQGCITLKEIPLLDTSNSRNVQSMFANCYSLKEIPLLDTSNSTTFYGVFQNCNSLLRIPQLNTSKGTTFYQMFNNCYSLKEIPELDTSKGTTFTRMFEEARSVQKILRLDFRSAASIGAIFKNCYKLKILNIYNIKASLQVGNGTTYGHLLTLDSLLNTIKELWNNTSGTSTKTLTVGTANLEKLANVYVKLIDITDEMRAEDEYIDNKLPFVVCESTDEGAMLVTDYVISKNWTLA